MEEPSEVSTPSPAQAILMGQRAKRSKDIRDTLEKSVVGFPQDVLVLNIVFDLQTGQGHISAPVMPEDIAATMRDVAHKNIEQWYENNRKIVAGRPS